jgi:hypothetical protein
MGMFKYVVTVTVNDHEFGMVFHFEQPAVTLFDSLVAETDREVEGDFIELPAAATVTVTKVALKRFSVDDPIGMPNRV